MLRLRERLRCFRTEHHSGSDFGKRRIGERGLQANDKGTALQLLQGNSFSYLNILNVFLLFNRQCSRNILSSQNKRPSTHLQQREIHKIRSGRSSSVAADGKLEPQKLNSSVWPVLVSGAFLSAVSMHRRPALARTAVLSGRRPPVQKDVWTSLNKKPPVFRVLLCAIEFPDCVICCSRPVHRCIRGGRSYAQHSLPSSRPGGIL